MRKIGLSLIATAILITGCATPEAPAPDLKEENVVKRETKYTNALPLLGQLTSMFKIPMVYVQTKGVVDDTGAATDPMNKAEIPYDITEMIKTSVNGIGGSLMLIDYDPAHQSNMMSLGYTDFSQKIKPSLVISGGITEFDRGLKTIKKGVNLDAESGNFGISGGTEDAVSMDRLAIDINLIDFDTWAMVPQMNASNSINLYMGRKGASVGFSILSNAFGYDASTKVIQGRHQAVRMLVEMSIVEALGRYMSLPYWKLLPNGEEDGVVIRNVLAMFNSAEASGQVEMIQKLLYLNGYDVDATGEDDDKTTNAINEYVKKQGLASSKMDSTLFKSLFTTIQVKNNFRTADLFGYGAQVAADAGNANVASADQANANASEPSDMTTFQEILSDKKITATGVFKNKNETIARQMAHTVAVSNLAKQVGAVLQEENTVLHNDQFDMLIKTQSKNIVKGYSVVKESYSPRSGRAEVELQLEGSVLAGQLENLLGQ